MKHIFIINPAAGKYDRTEEFSGKIAAACASRGLDYAIHVSEKPGDCRDAARRAAESGEEVRLYACGGDGTLNEVVNGAAGFANAAVTHFPGGSGNDAIKIFSEPAAFTDLDRLLDAEEARLDLIRCNGMYALNILSIGLDARIGTDIARYKRLPFVTGKGAYILSTINNLFRGISQYYRVTLDGSETGRGPPDHDLHLQRPLVRRQLQPRAGCRAGRRPSRRADRGEGQPAQVAGVIGKYQKGRYADYPHLIRHVRCHTVLRRM